MFIEGLLEHHIIIQKSEFICYLKRCDDLEEYRSFLLTIRKKHHDASHVASAYIAKDIRRSSDDGEPSGTAGIPILTVLEKNGMMNTAALVVRYFGGIKLGAGGLIRAYGGAVSEGLKKASLYEEAELQVYKIAIPYSLNERLEYYLKQNASIIDIDYGEEVTFTYATTKDITANLLSFSKGKAPLFCGYKITKIFKDLLQ